jgi:hypothetical protein
LTSISLNIICLINSIMQGRPFAEYRRKHKGLDFNTLLAMVRAWNAPFGPQTVTCPLSTAVSTAAENAALSLIGLECPTNVHHIGAFCIETGVDDERKTCFDDRQAEQADEEYAVKFTAAQPGSYVTWAEACISCPEGHQSITVPRRSTESDYKRGLYRGTAPIVP